MATMHDDQRPAAEDLPPLPRPWRATAEPPRRGCGRPLLAGCGCLMIGFIGVLAVLQWQREAILDWSIRVGEESLMSLTGDSLNEAQRNRVAGAFATFRSAVDRGTVDFDTAVELNRQWNAVLRSSDGSKLGWDEILPLVEALEALASRTAPQPGEAQPARQRRAPGEVA